jgi:hypothetical protein
MELWVGCVAGALEEHEFIALLEETGFEDVSIEPTRVYSSRTPQRFSAAPGWIPKCLPARWVDG